MRTTLCLLTAVSTGCLFPRIPLTDVAEDWDDADLILPEPDAGWRAASEPNTWLWTGDRDVVVRLVPESVGDETFGLYIEVDGAPLASWSEREWAGTPGWIPLLLVGTPSAGANADLSGALTLDVIGSDEHGCNGATTVAIDVRAGRLVVDVVGTPYMALPSAGVLTAVDAAGASSIAGSDVVADRSREYNDFESLAVSGGDFDGLRIVADQPVPWFQVQGHSDFIELDLDHSCEQEGFVAAGMRISLAW
jgi:hypothetical protein